MLAVLPLDFLADVEEAAELLLTHVVMEAQFLLLSETNAVFGIAAAAIAVHAGQFQMPWRCAWGCRRWERRLDGTALPSDRDSGPWEITFYGRQKARLKTCAAAAMADDLHAIFQPAWF